MIIVKGTFWVRQNETLTENVKGGGNAILTNWGTTFYTVHSTVIIPFDICGEIVFYIRLLPCRQWSLFTFDQSIMFDVISPACSIWHHQYGYCLLSVNVSSIMIYPKLTSVLSDYFLSTRLLWCYIPNLPTSSVWHNRHVYCLLSTNLSTMIHPKLTSVLYPIKKDSWFAYIINTGNKFDAPDSAYRRTFRASRLRSRVPYTSSKQAWCIMKTRFGVAGHYGDRCCNCGHAASLPLITLW